MLLAYPVKDEQSSSHRNQIPYTSSNVFTYEIFSKDSCLFG